MEILWPGLHFLPSLSLLLSLQVFFNYLPMPFILHCTVRLIRFALLMMLLLLLLVLFSLSRPTICVLQVVLGSDSRCSRPSWKHNQAGNYFFSLLRFLSMGWKQGSGKGHNELRVLYKFLLTIKFFFYISKSSQMSWLDFSQPVMLCWWMSGALDTAKGLVARWLFSKKRSELSFLFCNENVKAEKKSLFSRRDEHIDLI